MADELKTESRKVGVPVAEILSIVHCAEDYGWRDLLPTLAGWCDGAVSDADVESYIDTMRASATQYGDEDFDGARSTVGEWRARYCKPEAAAK